MKGLKMNKTKVIVIGGGSSVLEGINLGLWETLEQAMVDNPLLEVWSLNFVYLFMPFAPNAELFCDESFFINNKDTLSKLECPIITRMLPGHIARIADAKLKNVLFYPYIVNKFYGREGFTKGLFVGRDGLTGMFALSYAIARDSYKEIYLLGHDFGHNNKTARLTHWYQDMPKAKELIGHNGLGMSYIYNHKVDGIAAPNPKQGINDFDVYKGLEEKIYTVGFSRIKSFENISYERMFEIL
jgi:hypothetical protein